MNTIRKPLVAPNDSTPSQIDSLQKGQKKTAVCAPASTFAPGRGSETANFTTRIPTPSELSPLRDALITDVWAMRQARVDKLDRDVANWKEHLKQLSETAYDPSGTIAASTTAVAGASYAGWRTTAVSLGTALISYVLVKSVTFERQRQRDLAHTLKSLEASEQRRACAIKVYDKLLKPKSLSPSENYPATAKILLAPSTNLERLEDALVKDHKEIIQAYTKKVQNKIHHLKQDIRILRLKTYRLNSLAAASVTCAAYSGWLIPAAFLPYVVIPIVIGVMAAITFAYSGLRADIGPELLEKKQKLADRKKKLGSVKEEFKRLNPRLSQPIAESDLPRTEHGARRSTPNWWSRILPWYPVRAPEVFDNAQVSSPPCTHPSLVQAFNEILSPTVAMDLEATSGREPNVWINPNTIALAPPIDRAKPPKRRSPPQIPVPMVTEEDSFHDALEYLSNEKI